MPSSSTNSAHVVGFARSKLDSKKESGTESRGGRSGLLGPGDRISKLIEVADVEEDAWAGTKPS